MEILNKEKAIKDSLSWPQFVKQMENDNGGMGVDRNVR